MRFGVIADGVSARGNLADQFGAGPSELAYQEKRGAARFVVREAPAAEA